MHCVVASSAGVYSSFSEIGLGAASSKNNLGQTFAHTQHVCVPMAAATLGTTLLRWHNVSSI